MAKSNILCYLHLLNRFSVIKGHTHVQYYVYLDTHILSKSASRLIQFGGSVNMLCTGASDT